MSPLGKRRWMVLAIPGLWALSACGANHIVGSAPEVPAQEFDHTFYADYEVYDTLEDVYAKSDAVIKGKITGSRVEEQYPLPSTGTDPRVNPQYGVPADQLVEVPPMIYTVFTVAVDEVLAGDVTPGETVEVKQLGGTFEGQTYGAPGFQPLAAGSGEEYVLAIGTPLGSEEFAMVNPSQAVFTVEPGGKAEGLLAADDFGVKSVKELASTAEAAEVSS